jgi:hypothetical protein
VVAAILLDVVKPVNDKLAVTDFFVFCTAALVFASKTQKVVLIYSDYVSQRFAYTRSEIEVMQKNPKGCCKHTHSQ